jgi:glyoxylase-like metal-dependent hydrolase (beta-lactamase superfamily II)
MVPVGIALTHGHVDHLAALGRLQSSYANRGYTLPIAISPADRRFLGSGALEAHKESLKVHALDELAFFTGDAPELPKADVKLKEGDRIFEMDLVVIETPGHTPGSLCFYSEKEGVLFSGDTLFFDGVGRTDLPGGSERKLRESIEKKIAVLPPETRVFPGHGPFTTVERERRGNPFLRQPPSEPKPSEPQKPSRSTAGRPAKRLVDGRTKTVRPPKSQRVRANQQRKTTASRNGKPKAILQKVTKGRVDTVKPQKKHRSVERGGAVQVVKSAAQRSGKKKGC